MLIPYSLISVTRRIKRSAAIVILHNRPVNTSHLPNAGLMLVHCPGCWPNLKLALGQRLVLNDVAPSVTSAQP